MPSKAYLPFLVPEIKLLIISQLDEYSVSSIIATCKSFYELYKTHKSLINYEVALSILGDHLPLAIAFYAADHAQWKAQFPLPPCDYLVEKSHWFGRKYFDRKYLDRVEKLPIDHTDLTLPMIAEMASFYSLVKKWAVNYIDDQGIDFNTLTAGEARRVINAIYHIEVTRELFPFFQDYDGKPLNVPLDTLFHYLSPWEHQILINIVDFYEKVLQRIYDRATGTGPVYGLGAYLAEFGLRGLDKLRLGSPVPPALLNLRIGDANWPLRHEIWCVGYCDGGSFLRPFNGDLSWRIPKIDHILAHFPRDDDGPCALWFLRLHEDKRNLPHCIITRDGDRQWWDRSRIEALLPGVVPRVEELQEEALRGDLYDASMYTDPDEVDFPREIGY